MGEAHGEGSESQGLTASGLQRKLQTRLGPQKAFLLALALLKMDSLESTRFWRRELVFQVWVEKLFSHLCRALNVTLQPRLGFKSPLAQSPPKSAPAEQTQL